GGFRNRQLASESESQRTNLPRSCPFRRDPTMSSVTGRAIRSGTARQQLRVGISVFVSVLSSPCDELHDGVTRVSYGGDKEQTPPRGIRPPQGGGVSQDCLFAPLKSKAFGGGSRRAPEGSPRDLANDGG